MRWTPLSQMPLGPAGLWTTQTSRATKSFANTSWSWRLRGKNATPLRKSRTFAQQHGRQPMKPLPCSRAASSLRTLRWSSKLPLLLSILKSRRQRPRGNPKPRAKPRPKLALPGQSIQNSQGDQGSPQNAEEVKETTPLEKATALKKAVLLGFYKSNGLSVSTDVFKLSSNSARISCSMHPNTLLT